MGERRLLCSFSGGEGHSAGGGAIWTFVYFKRPPKDMGGGASTFVHLSGAGGHGRKKQYCCQFVAVAGGPGGTLTVVHF